MENKKICANCYYGVEAENPELVWCMYLGDLLNSLETEKLGEMMKHHHFSGSVFEGYLKQRDKDELKSLMLETSSCKNFKWKS